MALAGAGGDASGYTLVLGIGSGNVIDALLSATNRYLVVLETDAGKVESFRKIMHAAGLYGPRVTALAGDIRTAGLPPYFAASIVIDAPGLPEGADGVATIRSAFRSLRPFGGRLCLASDTAGGRARFEATCAAAQLEGAKVTRVGDLSVLTRLDLPQPTGNWGQSNGGNAARTLTIPDALIRAPLGLLWFGGDASDAIFGRLGSGLNLCSYGGRAFTFTADRIYALDAYTGRMLWSVPGMVYTQEDKKKGMVFFSPAVDAKGLYVSNGRRIVEYDPATGMVSRQFPVPVTWGLGANGHLILQDDLILLHSETALACISRMDGLARWTRQATENKMLSRVAVGDDHVFFAEGVGKKTAAGPAVSGELESVLLADGRTSWRVPLAGLPSSILYAAKAGLVLATWTTGLVDAHGAEDGRRIWSGNPALRSGWWNPAMPVIWNDRLILSGGQIVDIANGKNAETAHPLTGLPVPWSLPYKGFGCSMPNVVGDLFFSRGLDTVYYDLSNGGSMARLDGSRLACGWSVIPASGVLAVLNGQQFNMCNCRNPIASPMGLVHDPDVELWTISRFALPKQEPILRAGINLGAPGNRRAPDGTLWMDYPVVACPPFLGEKAPPDLTQLASSDPHPTVGVTPAGVEWFRHHSLRMQGDGLKWVAASGAKGIRSIKIVLPAPSTKPYTVSLVFAEPDSIQAGERVFAVSLQGRRVIEKLDIVAVTGAPRTVLTREFKGIAIGAALTVELTPIAGEPVLCGVALVDEAAPQGALP
jgi:outer membrane protein assembly factor BamB